MNLLESIATYLSSISTLGLTYPTTITSESSRNLFLQLMPTSPVVATTIIHTGGPNFPAVPLKFPTFQILHRNTHIGSGLAFVYAVNDLLMNKWNRLCATHPGRIKAITLPGPYAMEANKFPVYSLNYQLITISQGN